MEKDEGTEGSVCLEILLKLLFNFAESSDQENTLYHENSFFSVYMLYYLELLGIFTNWSIKNPAVSQFFAE